MKFLRNNPVVALGSIDKTITAVIAMLLVFGVISWSPEQMGAFILAFNSIIGSALMFTANAKTVSRDALTRLDEAMSTPPPIAPSSG